MKKTARKESNERPGEPKKCDPVPLEEEPDHKKRFEQLLDDATLGVPTEKKK